jgi:lysophospholipase L1-like esterase
MVVVKAVRRTWLLGVLALGLITGSSNRSALARTETPPDSQSIPLIRQGDRVAWVGSSSTRIGIWPRTVEFLIRTRHPVLDIQFKSFTTGGGTFKTGLENLDGWLDDYRPTVVVFNYGGNDAGAGREGLPRFKKLMEQCVARVQARGARVVLLTPQAADVRKSGPEAAANRTLYAETMLTYGRERGWLVIDIHHPLEAMQQANQKVDPAYTILKDKIHLTEAAYVGWGFLLYDRLNLPFARSAATLSADGRVTATENCEIQDVETRPGALSFTRIDEVLPILPPGRLPPRLAVPLESHSRYLLQVTGLEPGDYEIRCDGEVVGIANAGSLNVGLNLNSVLLDGGREPPWAAITRALWYGRELDRIGQTRWRFDVKRR